jgi:hypothetical protein
MPEIAIIATAAPVAAGFAAWLAATVRTRDTGPPLPEN